MPIYKLAQDMPYDEFLGWMDFFDQRPVGWRDDERTVKLMQVQGYKGSGEGVFPSLAKLRTRRVADDPIQSLKGSKLFSHMLSAKHGDALPFLKEV